MDINRNKNLKRYTDIVWLVLFLTFLALLILIAVISINYSGYNTIIKGHDSFGNICDSKDNVNYENFSQSGLDTTQLPYLYYMDIFNIPLVFKICLENCFIHTHDFHPVAIDFWREFDNYRCDYQISGIKSSAAMSVRYCPNVNVFNSTIYRHVCIPITQLEYAKEIYRAVSSEGKFAEMFFIAVYLSWPYVLALSGIAIFISLAFWPIIYFCTQFICWIICFLVVLCNIGLCMLLFYEENKKPPQYNIVNSTDEKTVQYYTLEEAITNRRILYSSGVILVFLMIIFFFALIFLRKYFSEITLLLNETTNYWKKLKKLMIIPLVALLVIVVVISLWSYVMLCLTTASYAKIIPTTEIEKNSDNDNHLRSFNRMEYVEENNIRSLIWIYIIGFLWITEFIVAAQQFVVGVLVVHFYFQLPEKHDFFQLQHHLGTIAKGSFIFTFYKIPKLVILNAGKLVKQINSKPYITQKLDWLEAKIGFLHPAAYTMVAMEQIDLCPAGKNTWRIMKKGPNLLRSISEMAFIMLFFLKLIVAFITCCVGVFLVNDLEDVHLFTAPLILSAIFGYCLANIVFSFFEMTLDTICFCVCEDSRINSHIGRWTKSNLELFLGQNRKHVQQASVTIVKT